MIASSLAYTLLGLASSAAASPFARFAASLRSLDVRGAHIEPRQTLQDIQTDITAIGTALATANNTVVSYQSSGLEGVTGLIDVNDNVVTLGDAITAATNAAVATPRLSPTDSTTVGIQFLFLQPNINLLLNNLVAKRTDFDGAAFGILDVRGLIHDTLVIQQNSSKALGDALINVLDPTLAGIATPINDQIQGNFTAAVNNFQGRSGVIKIPTSLVPTVSNLLSKLGPALEGILGIGDNKRDESAYCCGITQEKLDQMPADESDTSMLPFPVVAALKFAGIV